MSTPGSIAVPDIRAKALAHIRAGTHTIEEALDAAILEHGQETGNPLDDQTATFVRELLHAGIARHDTCSSCGGKLIGTERAFGTCGHCGGRSINPT